MLVIDVQNDFCPSGQLAVAGGDEIIPSINAMMADFETIVLTQDWHPQNHASLASNHPDAEPFSLTEMPYGIQVLWPDHCIQGTPGAEFHADLDRQRANLIIRKGANPQIDSYSAFFENDKQTPTGLHGYLQNLDINCLTCVGLALDFCVSYTAVDAAKLGYQVTVIETATRAIDLDGSLDAAMIDMYSNRVAIV